mmetsp:Transcript_12843/g.29122  ORF Transcript_12843/g.29122 Transcript_12843/m.29122 type:complete len:265 (+) Transcript_12843:524-1318(+)
MPKLADKLEVVEHVKDLYSVVPGVADHDLPMLRERHSLGELELPLAFSPATHVPHMPELHGLHVVLQDLEAVVQEVTDYELHLPASVGPRGLRDNVAGRVKVRRGVALLAVKGQRHVVRGSEDLDPVVALVGNKVEVTCVIEVDAARVVHRPKLVQGHTLALADLGLALALGLRTQLRVIRLGADHKAEGGSLDGLLGTLRADGYVQGEVARLERDEGDLVSAVLEVLNLQVVEGIRRGELSDNIVSTILPLLSLPVAGVDPYV